VRALFQHDELRTGDRAVRGLDRRGRHLVVATAEEQRRHLDPPEPGREIPVPERADHVELTRPVHRVVDLGILVEHGEALNEPVRPRLDPAKVPLVEHHHGVLVLRIRERAGFLVPAERRLDLGRQLRAQPRELVHPVRHARR